MPDRVQFNADRHNLGIFDGELRFNSLAPTPADAMQGKARVASFGFRFNEGYIRVLLKPREKGLIPAHDDRDGSYLTVDRSTDPAEVVLRDKPTMDSEWIFELVKPKGVGIPVGQRHAYIRSKNAVGESVWLDWGDEASVASQDGKRIRHLFKPVLSSKKILYMNVFFFGPDGK